MKRVTGIGGIFFQAKDPCAEAWYKKHLGIDVQDWGGTAFTWTDGDGKPNEGTTVWSIGNAEADQFAPSTSTFMVNYRVENLARPPEGAARGRLQRARQDRRLRYGKFGWVMDPEGNKVELWQPPAGSDRSRVFRRRRTADLSVRPVAYRLNPAIAAWRPPA